LGKTGPETTEIKVIGVRRLIAERVIEDEAVEAMIEVRRGPLGLPGAEVRDPLAGAPVRLKIPTQLGYKSAKWVSRIELVADLTPIDGGTGGYWEDQGYEWYAGI